VTGAAMTPRERMARAMRHEVPDRVPAMCQLSLGHYFLNSGLDEIDIWHDTETFAEALVRLQRRYGFDGILVNLPGRDPEWRSRVRKIETVGDERHIVWKNDWVTICPEDDNPHVYLPDRTTRYFPSFEEVDPERLYYMEPHDLSSITYPYSWGFDGEPASRDAFFPPWHWDTLKSVRAKAPDVSVHGEIFSPFSQFMEMLDYTNGLMALVDDAGKTKACLDALADGSIELARGHCRAGADAVLISSAFAGAGLISKDHYREFVLPCEKKVIAGVKAEFPDIPFYVHTCGAIGDRLEMMGETGTDGIDTLDPPPLGTVDLADAKRRVGERFFIKGNVDPVNTVLQGTPEETFAACRERVAIGKPGSGYILSTACSVAPAAPPANVEQFRRAVEEFGRYG